MCCGGMNVIVVAFGTEPPVTAAVSGPIDTPRRSCTHSSGIETVATVLDRRSDPKARHAVEISRHDVEAVNRKADRSLFAKRQKIHPKHAHGTFRTVKWSVMAVTLAIYYVLPWLRSHRGPDLPDQAVLLDIGNNRFFFFFLEIWPQEFYYVTGLLVLASLALFLATSVAGRVWCGYTCPQTVWTDLMISIERFWQGDRNARIRLDKEPWGATKFFKKVVTHVSWLAVGLLTGGALVFYFRDAPTLARELVTGTAPTIAYLFLGIFSATTYLLGGIAREQVCIYMCPWPRIQGAMTDSHTLLVTYRAERGEPRSPVRKGPEGLVDWSSRGDCIDCKACVAVCPTGIDIRDGSQLECIQCALCIDACDDIMDRVHRPRGLIGYDTVARIDAKGRGQHEPFRPVRPRTVLYASLFALVGAIMLIAWLNRTLLDVNVLPDRVPPYVMLTDGSVRNSYTVKILNKRHEQRAFRIALRDFAGSTVSVLGTADTPSPEVAVATDELREIRVFVTLPKAHARALKAALQNLSIIVTDQGSGTQTVRHTVFQAPSLNSERP
jgi:cytochrome c oxidase accessory protein FixG